MYYFLKILMLTSIFLLNFSNLFSQKVIKRTTNYVLIDTDIGIGNLNEVIMLQRSTERGVIDIGKVKLVRFKNGKAAAKIIKEFEQYRVEIGDFVKGSFSFSLPELSISEDSKIERYVRKSITILDVYSKTKIASWQEKLAFDLLLKRLNTLGRFDYNDVPIHSGIKMEDIFYAAREYAKSRHVQRARKQWNLEHPFYKEEIISGEILDKIINGVYIFVPYITDFKMYRNKKYKKTLFYAELSIDLEIWDCGSNRKITDSFIMPRKIATIDDSQENVAVSIMENLYSAATATVKEEIDPIFSEFASLKKSSLETEIENSLNILIKKLKDQEMFKIKTAIIGFNWENDLVRYGFGKDIGVKMNDSYYVVYNRKLASGTIKQEKIAYTKVRKIFDNKCDAQIIFTSNPNKLDEKDLLNLGDQVIEKAYTGKNYGYTYDVVNFMPMKDKNGKGKQIYNNTFHNVLIEIVDSENFSELYLLGSAGSNFKFDHNHSYYTLNFCFNLGIIKRYFKRRFGFNWGTGFGLYLVPSEKKELYYNLNEAYYTIYGFYGKFGTHYLLAPSFIIYGNIGIFAGKAEWDNEDGKLIKEYYKGYSMSFGFSLLL